MGNGININANMISWAITRAGYQLHEFLDKYPKADSWLKSEKQPTLKQLEDFSKKVHVPFGYLFLKEPPQENLPIPFFRTGKTGKEQGKVNINIYDTILNIQQRQDWLKGYLIENDHEQLPYVGKFEISSNYKMVVNDIRSTLGLEEDWGKGVANFEEALTFLTQKIEEIGVITVFNGVVENNTHRPIKVEECRGFVLVDKIVPFMFINAADGKAAQIFTIIHELAHIWIGQSAGFDFRQLQPSDDPIELLCDKVAAEFLVPEDAFIKIWSKTQDYKIIAKQFKVSPIVVARRALDTGKINRKSFFEFYNVYAEEYQQKKDNKASGGDFYATTRKRLSPTFVAYVDEAVKSNKLLYLEAYKLTSLKGGIYQKFINEYLIR